MSESKTAYVVSYLERGWTESTVTVFDNRENAEKMKQHIAESGRQVWMDECPIYHTYGVE